MEGRTSGKRFTIAFLGAVVVVAAALWWFLGRSGAEGRVMALHPIDDERAVVVRLDWRGRAHLSLERPGQPATWHVDLFGLVDPDAIAADDELVSARMLVGGAARETRAYRLDDGSIAWSAARVGSERPPGLAHPTLASGALQVELLGGDRGLLVGLDRRDGRERFREELAAGSARAFLAEGRALVHAPGAPLVARGPADEDRAEVGPAGASWCAIGKSLLYLDPAGDLHRVGAGALDDLKVRLALPRSLDLPDDGRDLLGCAARGPRWILALGGPAGVGHVVGLEHDGASMVFALDLRRAPRGAGVVVAPAPLSVRGDAPAVVAIAGPGAVHLIDVVAGRRLATRTVAARWELVPAPERAYLAGPSGELVALGPGEADARGVRLAGEGPFALRPAQLSTGRLWLARDEHLVVLERDTLAVAYAGVPVTPLDVPAIDAALALVAGDATASDAAAGAPPPPEREPRRP